MKPNLHSEKEKSILFDYAYSEIKKTIKELRGKVEDGYYDSEATGIAVIVYEHVISLMEDYYTAYHMIVPTKQSESMTTKTECCGKCSHDEDVKCPECGEDKHYRIIYTDDEMTEVDFYDCMVCHTHWSWEHV